MPPARRPTRSLSLTAPVIFLIVAATAIPVQFRSPRAADVTLVSSDLSDIAANVVLYVPLGMVLGGAGVLRATLIGAALSTAAESGQLVMLHRDPSLIDVLTNLAGAGLGAWLFGRRNDRWRRIGLRRWMAIPSLGVALAAPLYVASQAGRPVNPRGVSQPGALEAAWSFDRPDGRVATDGSPNHLDGRFRRAPAATAGILGGAAVFERGNYLRVPQATALRLEGSMTITAWINSTVETRDDAAVVSQLTLDRGYQLDTTVDRGERTIGYKLTDACGQLMIRYGATPLTRGTWHHLAGVYDATARTLHVYLDGRLDDGDQVGEVSGVQRSGRGPVYVGRRPGTGSWFDFGGALDDVRVYSFALSEAQVGEVMAGASVASRDDPRAPRPPTVERQECAGLTDREDKDRPIAAAVMGLFLALAIAIVWPNAGPWAGPAVALAAGLVFVVTSATGLPAFNLWALPLTACLGAVCVQQSRRSFPGD